MEKMITSPEVMENIMVATPSLSQDPVAVGEYIVCIIVLTFMINSPVQVCFILLLSQGGYTLILMKVTYTTTN